MDISQKLADWLASEKSEVEPSLLAYVLLYSTKNLTGLVDVLKYLVSSWNQGDAACRTKCIELLAQVIVPSQSALDSSTNNAIIQFISDRLDDPVLVPRCVDILAILIQSESISSTDVIQLCSVIFTHIKVKKLPQQSRYKVLIILAKTLEKYASETQSSKINFIGGFINCMDGEKDPRNLMVAFELVRAIIDRFDISRHIEDLFDVVFCYFPISFAAPANDPFSITTQDLKESLRRCLASTPYFAYYATPLLIEKLLSTTGSAKKDAMETISLCAPAYGAHAILPHAQDLFNALVREVYQEADASMVQVALNTIHNVVATLGTGISIANIRDPVEKAIDSLLQKCVEELKEPELKNARSAAYILRAAASASDPACTSVTHAALPIICQQHKTTDPAVRRKAVLDILTELLVASKTLYGSVEDIGYDRDFQTPLLMFKQQIFQLLMLPLVEPNTADAILKYASLKGIHEMVLMKQFLKGEEMNMTVDQLTRQLVRPDAQLRSLCLSTLGVISKLYPMTIGQRTFPVLLELLPSLDDPVISDTYNDVLDAIQVLGAHPAVFKIIVQPLVDKVDFASRHIGQENISFVHAIASTLLKVYKAASKDCEIVTIGRNTLLPTLLIECIKSVSGNSESWYLDDTLIEIFAMMAAITTRLSSCSEQQASVNDMFKLFVHGDFSQLDQSVQIESLPIFGDITHAASANDITLLFTAIISNCCKDVQLPIANLSGFTAKLIQTAIQTPSDARREALSKIAASIINKWLNDELLGHVKSLVTEHLLPTSESATTHKRSAFPILVWIIKALIIRGHRYGFELLDSVIEQCGSSESGKDAVDSFIALLHEDELILNKKSHSIVSILFKQRVFTHCFRKLMNGAELADIRQPDLQVNYLLALIHVLQNIPRQVATNEIRRLMLPIIVALSSHDSTLIKATLSVAQNIVPDAQDLVAQHLGSFIHALLRLTRFQSSNVRISALECLASIAVKGKPDVLSPFTPSVVKELSTALDDKKRLVRRNAVDCREKWYAIGK
ncbi:Dos2-interacting transcription regulator of RNA-Pol-II-domain-containing protein [Parasitella parasitica]|nr:Dos2-interacting transcription regulator of RNA-Pol-II-domain-containing protein [Parasitella parasitica]